MSVPGFCDELIIVDTGSEDSTPQIAREFGAILKIHPWRDDYSWMRNKSFSYATGDWIFYIDADEEMIGTKKEFLQAKKAMAQEKKFNAFVLTMEDMIKGEVQQQQAACRIFRKGKVRFESIIHNRPEIEGGPQAKPLPGGLIMRHYGYDLSPEEMDRKYQRRLRLLKKKLELNPSDFEAYFYLAQTYGTHQKIDEAQKAAEIYIKNKPRIPRFNNAIYPLLADIYLKKGKDQGLEWIFHHCEEFMSLDVDMAWLFFQWAVGKKDLKMVMAASEKYIHCYRVFNSSESIEERGSKFIFHYSEKKYGTALATSAANFLKVGMERLEQFGELSTQTPEEMPIEDLRDVLLNIGIQWNHTQ
jgi:glycosyltransferase involved in cell wall biosynthesis